MVEQTRQYVWGNDWHYWTTRCVHEGLMQLLLSHWLCSKNVNVFIIHPTQVYTSDVRLWRRPFIDWDTDKDLLTGYHSQLKHRETEWAALAAVDLCLSVSRHALCGPTVRLQFYMNLQCHPPHSSLAIYNYQAAIDYTKVMSLMMSRRIWGFSQPRKRLHIQWLCALD